MIRLSVSIYSGYTISYICPFHIILPSHNLIFPPCLPAIHGKNFCRSAQKAFSVIIGNAVRVAAINSVGAFVLFLGKCGVAVTGAMVGLNFFFKVRVYNYSEPAC